MTAVIHWRYCTPEFFLLTYYLYYVSLMWPPNFYLYVLIFLTFIFYCPRKWQQYCFSAVANFLLSTISDELLHLAWWNFDNLQRPIEDQSCFCCGFCVWHCDHGQYLAMSKAWQSYFIFYCNKFFLTFMYYITVFLLFTFVIDFFPVSYFLFIYPFLIF